MPSSGIISYQVDGKQYVAVVVGMNNLHIGALAGDLMRRPQGGAPGSAPSTRPAPPKGGAAIWVFAL
jgi:hypothetical protein